MYLSMSRLRSLDRASHSSVTCLYLVSVPLPASHSLVSSPWSCARRSSACWLHWWKRCASSSRSCTAVRSCSAASGSVVDVWSWRCFRWEWPDGLGYAHLLLVDRLAEAELYLVVGASDVISMHPRNRST
eukprot:5395862-Amphidinium_carterae.1